MSSIKSCTSAALSHWTKESNDPLRNIKIINSRNSAPEFSLSHNHSLLSPTSASSPPCCPGGNQHGVFDLGLVQDEWKMYVKQPLDREKNDLYVINVTASDGLFVCETTVVVTVMDTNDNAPVFVQVRIEW